jgi:hypothetical protein
LLKVIIFLHFVWDLPWFADISWRLYIISFCNVFFLWCIHWYFFIMGSDQQVTVAGCSNPDRTWVWIEFKVS